MKKLLILFLLLIAFPVFARVKTATLWYPQSGKKIRVEVGSQYAQKLFGYGFKLYDGRKQKPVFLGVGSGALSPSVASDDATVGTITWDKADDVKISDQIYAAATSTSAITHYIKANQFGFSIPVNSIINGITVEVQKMSDYSDPILNNYTRDFQVSLVKSDSSIGLENKADAVTNWDTSEKYVSYGSSSDLWSETWTANDINNNNFGVVFSANVGGGVLPVTAYVDHIRITVDYTEIIPPTIQGIDTIEGVETITF